MDITAVVVLNETPAVTAAVAVDETTLQATVNPLPEGGGGDGGSGGGDGDGGASLGNAIPQPLGTPSAGTALTASRIDHRHAMPTAAQVGADATGTAAAAVAAHAAAAAPHSIYTTPAEAAAAAPVQSVTLSAPSGWSASSTNTGGGVTLTLGLPTGFSLPSNSSQANWDTAYAERVRWDGGSTGLNPATGRTSLGLGSAAQLASSDLATAAQGAKADTAVQPATLTSGLAGKADLVAGVVPTSQIPAIAISDYLGAVGSEAAMLALTGQRGDWCLRTDGLPNTGQWILGADTAALLSSWVQVPLPTVPVQSVNGQAGVIVLGTGDLAESGGNLFFTAARAIGAALTGFTAGAGTVEATDSILAAFQKVVGNIAGRALSGAIGNSGITMATARILGRSAAGVGAPEEFGLLGLAFSGANLATLADLVIPLSDETTALTASPTTAKVTIPYWPRATTLTDPWIWAVAAAPTGAALQFDIQVNGTSIYLPASGGTYPTIAASSTNSTSSAGAFTTAFAAAPTIPVGSSVSFFVRQIGSTVAGAGLKVVAQTRRAG